MFPLGPLPTSKEAWLITCADKICATMELFQLHIALAKPGRVKISAAEYKTEYKSSPLALHTGAGAAFLTASLLNPLSIHIHAS